MEKERAREGLRLELHISFASKEQSIRASQGVTHLPSRERNTRVRRIPLDKGTPEKGTEPGNK